MKSNKRTIELPDDGSKAVVIRGGVKVAFNDGGVTVYTNGDVRVRPAVSDDAPREAMNYVWPKTSAEPRVGDTMEDGTIFAGISPDTGGPMYTTPADVPLTMKWKVAMDYAVDHLDAHGHSDWKLPSKAELNVLFKNRARIGGFDESGSFLAGYYWSSSEYNHGFAWNQRFSDGDQHYNFVKYNELSVRCVRR